MTASRRSLCQRRAESEPIVWTVRLLQPLQASECLVVAIHLLQTLTSLCIIYIDVRLIQGLRRTCGKRSVDPLPVPSQPWIAHQHHSQPIGKLEQLRMGSSRSITRADIRLSARIHKALAAHYGRHQVRDRSWTRIQQGQSRPVYIGHRVAAPSFSVAHLRRLEPAVHDRSLEPAAVGVD